jgi:hypothetical protein
MIKLIQLIILLAVSITAHADSFYNLIRYKCDLQHDHVIISYVGAYNEAGEDLIENKGEDAWEPWTLVDIDSSGERITKLRVIKKQCRLSDGVYNVSIGPTPYTTNINGRCGALMGMPGWVEIKKDDKVIIHRQLDPDACSGGKDAQVVTELSLAAGAKAASLKQVSQEKFAGW